MKVISTNKKAYHEYHILEKFEAGIVLTGNEIKSIRANCGALREAFVHIRNGEVVVVNWHISAYTHAYGHQKYDPTGPRKLLLHKKEIHKITGGVARKGLTVMPLCIGFNARGFLKMEIGLAKHKNLVDKKKDLKDRDLRREASRDLKMTIK